MRSDRLLAILLTLQARGRATAPELAERLEVSVRTVYRDVEALSSAGVPVYTEQGRGGGIRLLEGYRTDATGLTQAEAGALFTFSGRGVLPDDAADRHLRSAFRKLLAALPESRRGEAERAEQRILVEPRPWMRRGDQKVPMLPVVQEAVLRGERLQLRYHAAGRSEPGDYEVDPVGLVVKAGVWYLVAYRGDEPRMFRVGRIRKAEPIGPASLPADVPPLAELWDRMRARFEQPGGGVRVDAAVPKNRAGLVLGVCSAELIDRPERRLHPEEADHEILTLTFRSAAHAWWMLAALAEHVEVIGPNEVRDELVRNAQATLERYR
ncbi:MAG: helix-turn-helix transcriptional regulator [Actinomycetota bacterium]